MTYDCREQDYYWLNRDGKNEIISINTFEKMIYEGKIGKKKSHPVSKEKRLFPHGKLHPPTVRNVKYIPK